MSHLQEFTVCTCAKTHKSLRAPKFTLDGSWVWEIVDELKPGQSDRFIQIKKQRGSAFIGTNFTLLLRSYGIKTLIMSGILTEGCVKSTARDALHFGYFVVHAKDCVDSHDKKAHDASLKHTEKGHPVVDSSKIINIWQEAFSNS